MLQRRIPALFIAAAARSISRSPLSLSLTTRDASRVTRHALHNQPTPLPASSALPSLSPTPSSSSVDALPPPLAQAWLSLGLPPPSLIVVADLNLRAPAPVQVPHQPSQQALNPKP